MATSLPNLVLLATLAFAATSAARADDYAFGRRLFLDKAQCLYCHGWAGDGAGEPQSNGAAANLRVTPLKRDQLIEVITCGVPGKAMPHFDEQAYTDKRCYGVSETELGRDTPALPPGGDLEQARSRGGRRLSPRQGDRPRAGDHPRGMRGGLRRRRSPVRPLSGKAGPNRHGRACRGHPRLTLLFLLERGVDGRNKSGHDLKHLCNTLKFHSVFWWGNWVGQSAFAL